MAKTHTPGPWRVSNYTRVVGPDDGGLGNNIICEARTVANAALIASAPDLLAALESLDRAFSALPPRKTGWKLTTFPYSQVIAARAAIAKAHGKVPA